MRRHRLRTDRRGHRLRSHELPNALLRYYQLQQHLIQLPANISHCATARWRATSRTCPLAIAPSSPRGATARRSTPTAIPPDGSTGVNTGAGRRRLPAGHDATPPVRTRTISRPWTPDELSRVKSQYASVELADGANITAMATIGAIRGQRPESRDPDREPRKRFAFRRPRSQHRSLRPEQDQRRERSNPALRSGFQQTPRFAS